MREVDTVARIGGDEFLIVQTEVKDDSSPAFVAEKVIREISAPFKLNGSSVSVGASVGIALYPDHGDDADLLIHKADGSHVSGQEIREKTITGLPFNLFKSEL